MTEEFKAAGGVQSVDRAATVLEILARDGLAGVSDIAEEIGIHKSSASRLLAALQARELVQQDSERGKYRLGFGILRLAAAIPGQLNLVHEGSSILRALALEAGETVNLAVQRSGYAVNVDQAMGPATLASQDWVGSLTPLHATASGKVLLAGLSSEERAEVIKKSKLAPFTSKTITDRAELEKELAEVAATGFGFSDEDFEYGLVAVAVPVRDHMGTVFASVSISGPKFRFDPHEKPELLDKLATAGLALSRRMGYVGPEI